MPNATVSADEFAALDGLDDWRYLLGTIQADFRAGSFPAAAALVAAIADAAEAADHHPDLDLRYPDRVRVVWSTHSAGGVTTRDVELARATSALARDAGATAEPKAAQSMEVAIDTMDADRIRPFWAAILGYREADGALVDPLHLGPTFWFQQMDEPRTDRDRFHIDVTVAHDVADERVAAAIAAGGRLVTDRFARSWWVLADADGNEACVCTWQDRDREDRPTGPTPAAGDDTGRRRGHTRSEHRTEERPMAFHPYLMFGGDCRQALTRYHEIFGGELSIMAMSDLPPGAGEVPAEQADLVMHATLVVGDSLLMGSDDPNGGSTGIQGVSISHSTPNAEEARRIFDLLAEGGQVTMPMDATFWSPAFGMCVDRFGVPWMVDAEHPDAGQPDAEQRPATADTA